MNSARTPEWLRVDGADVTLTLHVQPGARRTGATGVHGGALKIQIHAPPLEGKANAALIAYLARALALPRARFELIAGESSRAKRVRVSHVTADAVVAAFIGDLP